MTWSVNMLLTEAMKIEGQRFKLLRQSDKAKDLNEYVRLQKEIYQLNVKHQQYLNIISEFKDGKRKVPRWKK